MKNAVVTYADKGAGNFLLGHWLKSLKDNVDLRDIDVIVISDSFSGKDYWERIELLSDAIYEVFEPIEAVGLTIEEWDRGESGIVDFAKQGEIVYSA